VVFDSASREMSEVGRCLEAIFDERARPASRQLDRVRLLALAKALMSNANLAAAILNVGAWWWRGCTLTERWRD
jgi:hypothetical protein